MDITTIIIYIAAAALIIFGIYYTVQKFRGKAKSSCCGTPEVKAVRKVDDTSFAFLNTLFARRLSKLRFRSKILPKTLKLPKKEYRREDFEEALAGTSYKVAGFCEKNKISTADSTEIGI